MASSYLTLVNNVLRDMNESVSKMSDKLGMRVIDPKSFDNYLNGAGGERGYKVALREIFGKEYVKNLDTLNNALQVIARNLPQEQQRELLQTHLLILLEQD